MTDCKHSIIMYCNNYMLLAYSLNLFCLWASMVFHWYHDLWSIADKRNEKNKRPMTVAVGSTILRCCCWKESKPRAGTEGPDCESDSTADATGGIIFNRGPLPFTVINIPRTSFLWKLNKPKNKLIHVFSFCRTVHI